jgi:glycosyltransferase involved in cell wall biosynthesis
VKPAIAFLLEDLDRDLAANDLAGIISDLDGESFASRVLSLSGDARSISPELRAALPSRIPIKGPLRRPLWNVGLIRRFLLDVKEAKPAVLVFAGGKDVLEFAAKAVGWVQRPAVYLAPSGDAAFPWGQRKALDVFAKIVATTGQLTYRLVEEMRVPEAKVATIYPGIDTERFALAPMPGASGARGASGAAAGEGALVGVVGDPPKESVDAIAAEFAGGGETGGARGASSPSAGESARDASRGDAPVRLAAPRGRAPVIDLGPSWTPEAFARVSLLLFLSDADWESAFEAILRGMAVGRPVIAAVPSARVDDMVVEGETGRLVAEAAPAAIAAAVRELLSAPDLLASMGIAARMRIAGEFGRARRRMDWDALLRVLGGIPFAAPPIKGPQGEGPPSAPITFKG